MIDLAFIKSIAIQAGRILKDGFGRQHDVHFKSEIDLVTEMDRASEDFLLGEVRRSDPLATLVSEESGTTPGTSANCWYIDPLDGTINYAHGIPIFTVSIAYQVRGDLTLAVVYDPMRDELFSAERGKGAWLNGNPIRVSHTTELIRSLLVTGFPYDIRTNLVNNLDHFGWFAQRTRGVRRLGSAALDLAYVAAGRLDGYWELGIKPWDIAAGILLACEAGAVVSDMKGGADYFSPPYALVTANPSLHPKILEGLRR